VYDHFHYLELLNVILSIKNKRLSMGAVPCVSRDALEEKG
jgi:hypothetical protein